MRARRDGTEVGRAPEGHDQDGEQDDALLMMYLHWSGLLPWHGITRHLRCIFSGVTIPLRNVERSPFKNGSTRAPRGLSTASIFESYYLDQLLGEHKARSTDQARPAFETCGHYTKGPV